MELTQWHKGSVKPVHKGVYQREYPSGLFYCRWTGEYWLYGEKKIREAFYSDLSGVAFAQHLPWCGLAKKPKGE